MKHVCPGDAMEMATNGRHLPSAAAECGTCHRKWCARCDPTPASLCPYCCADGSRAPLGNYKMDRERSARLAGVGSRKPSPSMGPEGWAYCLREPEAIMAKEVDA